MLKSIEHGPVHEIQLDRPPANALTAELLVALQEAVEAAPERGARALVLSGAPGMFSAGLDVPYFLELDRQATGEAWRALFGAMSALIGSSIPVAAALTGHAPAGGCVLALCCDQRILARGKFKIGLNEVAVGVRVPQPILDAAEHVVGMRQAERMCTSAQLLGGDEALRIGLVDELVEPEAVVPRAVEWAQATLELPPITLRKTRGLCRRRLLESFEDIDEENLELFLDEWFGEECQSSLRALVERLSAR